MMRRKNASDYLNNENRNRENRNWCRGNFYDISCTMKINNKISGISLLLSGVVLTIACESDEQVTANAVPASTPTAIAIPAPQIVPSQDDPSVHVQSNKQITIGNKRYLYDISEHDIDDLKLLLQRADEITQAGGDNLDKLEIVMILHGPDIGWFTLDNYDDNKDLVDLAKKLDAFDIIDLKVCETTMKSMSIGRNQLPSFIESIPYAPDELNRLTREGYTHF